MILPQTRMCCEKTIIGLQRSSDIEKGIRGSLVFIKIGLIKHIYKRINAIQGKKNKEL